MSNLLSRSTLPGGAMAELLRRQTDLGWSTLLESLEGLTEEQAWAQIAIRDGEYLHTEGSILSIVVHLASCKFLYGSAAYRDLDVRWSHTVERIDAFWPRWQPALEYLHEAHGYWMRSWRDEVDFDRVVKTNWDADWPSWRVVWTVAQHDVYHAAQIQILRVTANPSGTPPPPETHLWRQYASEYSW